MKATGLTPMPLWLGPQPARVPVARHLILGPPAYCWIRFRLRRCSIPATPQQIAQKVTMPYACTTYLYAPLATIYSFKMDADEAAAWNAVQKGIGGSGGTASAGDYGVLGMHVNSKEIINWTWQTFWWQPGRMLRTISRAAKRV